MHKARKKWKEFGFWWRSRVSLQCRAAVHCCFSHDAILLLCYYFYATFSTAVKYIAIIPCYMHAAGRTLHVCCKRLRRLHGLYRFTLRLKTNSKTGRWTNKKNKIWRTAIRGIIIVRSYTYCSACLVGCNNVANISFPCPSIPFSHHHIHTRAHPWLKHTFLWREREANTSGTPHFLRTVFSRKET